MAALTPFATGLARVGDGTLELVGVEPVRGDISAPLLEGRLPVSDDEIGLGRLTAASLGTAVGDELTVGGEIAPERMRVTGIVVVPSVSGVDGVGTGAVVPMSSLQRLDSSLEGGLAAVTLRADAPPGTADRLTTLTGMETGAPNAPPTIVSAGRVRSIPFLLAGVLGALAVLSVGHVMLTSVRGRRRDLAVLRAIGSDRTWIARAVHWQGTAFTVFAVAIGAPLGVIVGRQIFITFADNLGAVDDPAVPLGLVAIVAVAALAIANAVAFVSARRARRLDPATLLRPE